MKLLSCIIFLPFAMILALSQYAYQCESARMPKKPEALISSLFKEVTDRHPLGLPKREDMKIYAPYLSKALLQRIDVVRACYDDWFRQIPDPNLKPPFGWLESGLFSGSNERASPRDFKIEKTQSENDGSFRVYIKLTREDPPAPKLIWQVAAIVVQEKDRYVVNDIIFLKEDGVLDVEVRLSESLTTGCFGPRWAGFGDQ